MAAEMKVWHHWICHWSEPLVSSVHLLIVWLSDIHLNVILSFLFLPSKRTLIRRFTPSSLSWIPRVHCTNNTKWLLYIKKFFLCYTIALFVLNPDIWLSIFFEIFVIYSPHSRWEYHYFIFLMLRDWNLEKNISAVTNLYRCIFICY
jgi:hypothetical protein